MLVHFLEKENEECWCTFRERDWRNENIGALFREGDWRMMVPFVL